jgi:hypothetical protein
VGGFSGMVFPRQRHIRKDLEPAALDSLFSD